MIILNHSLKAALFFSEPLLKTKHLSKMPFDLCVLTVAMPEEMGFPSSYASCHPVTPT